MSYTIYVKRNYPVPDNVVEEAKKRVEEGEYKDILDALGDMFEQVDEVTNDMEFSEAEVWAEEDSDGTVSG